MIVPDVPYGEVARGERPMVIVNFEAPCPGCGETVSWHHVQSAYRQPSSEPDCDRCAVVELPEADDDAF